MERRAQLDWRSRITDYVIRRTAPSNAWTTVNEGGEHHSGPHRRRLANGTSCGFRMTGCDKTKTVLDQTIGM
jgi:hypothetical protein